MWVFLVPLAGACERCRAAAGGAGLQHFHSLHAAGGGAGRPLLGAAPPLQRLHSPSQRVGPLRGARRPATGLASAEQSSLTCRLTEVRCRFIEGSSPPGQKLGSLCILLSSIACPGWLPWVKSSVLAACQVGSGCSSSAGSGAGAVPAGGAAGAALAAHGTAVSGFSAPGRAPSPARSAFCHLSLA